MLRRLAPAVVLAALALCLAAPPTLMTGRAQRRPRPTRIGPPPQRGPASVEVTEPESPQEIKLTRPVRQDMEMLREAVVQKDAETGQVRRGEGKPRGPGGETPGEAARNFYFKNAGSLLGQKNTLGELREVTVQTETGTFVTLSRYYRGLPIFDDNLTVKLDDENRVLAFSNALREVSDLALVRSTHDRETAVAAAVAAVKAAHDTQDPIEAPTAVEGINVASGVPVAVWRVSFLTKRPPASWQVMVDAGTNEVIAAQNVAQYAHGSGMVYEPNPVRSLGDASLLDGLADLSLDTPALTGARVRRVFKELDGSGFLQGTYATTNLPGNEPRAFQPLLNFDYTRSDPRFQESMAYYWVTENALYLRDLRMRTPILNRPVQIAPHFADVDNSFYNGQRVGSYHRSLMFGDGGVKDAEDAEVILHELGHAIIDEQIRGTDPQSEFLTPFGNPAASEERAISEGFGDYWAASFFRDGNLPGVSFPRGNAWDPYWASWNGAGNAGCHPAQGGAPAFCRKLDSRKRYPADMTPEQNAYQDCEIWSATLWQIMTLLGKREADRLILASHSELKLFRHTRPFKFKDAATAILKANRILNAGSNQTALENIFNGRGIPFTRS